MIIFGILGVIPVEAGIQFLFTFLDPGFRRGDGMGMEFSLSERHCVEPAFNYEVSRNYFEKEKIYSLRIRWESTAGPNQVNEK